MSSPTLPSIDQLSETLIAQLELKLGQTIPILPKSFSRVLAVVLAGAFTIQFKYSGFSLLQQFVQFATNEETVINGRTIRPLTEWGRLIGVGDPLEALRASIVLEVTVLNQTGYLPSGSQVMFAPAGVLYITTAPVLLNAATVLVPAQAVSDQNGGAGAGIVGNRQVGDVLQFANPLPNVAKNCTVASQTVQGAEAETIDAYRARIVRRVQRRPQGGASADYQDWAESVEGIANAYPYRGTPGVVRVFVEATPESSGSADGIPTSAQLLTVAARNAQTEQGLAARRPVSAAVDVLPIVRIAFNVRVEGLDASNAGDAQQVVTDALRDYIRSAEPFIVGLTPLPRRDRISNADVSGIVSEAVNAVGGTVIRVFLFMVGSTTPTDVYQFESGEKASLNTVSFIEA